MTWDATAVAVGIHALGAVEANMDYGAINPTDPISIGIFQWFGTRAAAILQTIAVNNPTSWASVDSSLRDDVSAHTSSDTFWNSRHLTTSEASSLSPVLVANKDVQDGKASLDLGTYKNVAVDNGMNPNTNTQSVLFFCNMYNQSPVAALRVMRAATVGASLTTFRDKALADSTLGAYASRYNQAYTIINAMDTGGVNGQPDTTPNDPQGPQAPTDNTINRVELVGNEILVHTSYGKVYCIQAGPSSYVPRNRGSVITAPDPGGVTPDPGSPAVNDYPFPTKPIGSASPYNFYYRECVDFCAWRIRSRTARTTFTNAYKGVRWGNANNWDNAATAVGIRVDSTPSVGSVAFRNRGTYGHVAWVYVVNADGSYGTEEYNTLNDHEYHTYNPADDTRFDGFIHFEDAP